MYLFIDSRFTDFAIRFLESCRRHKFQNHCFYKFYYLKPRIIYNSLFYLFSRIIYSTDVQCPDIDLEALEKTIDDKCNFEIDSTSSLNLPGDSLIPREGSSWNPSKEIAGTQRNYDFQKDGRFLLIFWCFVEILGVEFSKTAMAKCLNQI